VDNHHGQMLVRFQGLSDARTAIEDCGMGDDIRIVFVRMARGHTRSERKIEEYESPSGFQAPFGSPPGAGGGIA